MSYFAIERNGETWDHITIVDHEKNIVFGHYLNMTYDEMKSQGDLEDFVIAVMEATNAAAENYDEQTIINLINDDNEFVWGILMGPGDNDTINYNLINWKKDGKNYRYEN